MEESPPILSFKKHMDNFPSKNQKGYFLGTYFPKRKPYRPGYLVGIPKFSGGLWEFPFGRGGNILGERRERAGTPILRKKPSPLKKSSPER